MLGPGALARGPDRGGLPLADDARRWSPARRLSAIEAATLPAQAIDVGPLAVDAASGLVPRLGEPLEGAKIRQQERVELADIAGPGPKRLERLGQRVAQSRESAFGRDPARRMIAAAQGHHHFGEPRDIGPGLASTGLLQPLVCLGQRAPRGLAFALRTGNCRNDAGAALQERPQRAQPSAPRP